MLKNLIKKVILLIAVSLMFTNVYAIAIDEKTNLVNGGTTLVNPQGATFENGVLKVPDSEGEKLVRFTTAGLKNKYSWSGDVKILHFKDDKSSNGIRFCIGYNKDTNDYLNLMITKNIGITAERRGPSPESDIIPLSKDFFSRVLADNDEFHFEILKQGSYIILKIDGVPVVNTNLSDKYDFFTDDYPANLGFYASNCAFEVRNLAVYNETSDIIPDSYQLDFDHLPDGVLARGIYENWFIEWPAANSSAVQPDVNGKNLMISGFFQGAFAYTVRDAYTFGLKLKGTQFGQLFGIFVRAGNEMFLSKSVNAPHGEYFETDSATDAGIGSTGIYILPLQDSNVIRLYVKCRNASQPKGITSTYTDIDISSIMGSDTLITAAADIRIEDDGLTIRMYIKDTLFAIVELSGETTTYPDYQTVKNVSSKDSYVKKVTVKNAAGNELFNVVNTLVSAEYSTLGLGARAVKPMQIDALSVNITLEEPPVNEPETEEENPETADNTIVIKVLYTAAISVLPLFMLKKHTWRKRVH